jgi:transcriptional regulator with XRE-family HTH domain
MGALGAFIRSQRQLARLSSLRQLAELTSLSNPYLSQVERGMHQPSVRVLKLIAEALNISAETLLVQAGLLDAEDPDAAARPPSRSQPRSAPTTGSLASRKQPLSPSTTACSAPTAAATSDQIAARTSPEECLAW